MKLYIRIMLSALLLGAFTILPAAADSAVVQALPSTAMVLADGQKLSFQAYEIDGYNYFKIRDLAVAFAGTRQKFVPGAHDRLSQSGAALSKSFGAFEKYKPVGDELQAGDGVPQSAVPAKCNLQTDSTIWVDAPYTPSQLQCQGYTIADYNYIRLRDLATAFDFGVRWNAAQARIEIDTERPYVLSDYTPPARTDTPVKAGWAYESEKMAFINEMPILSYVIDAAQKAQRRNHLYRYPKGLGSQSFRILFIVLYL